MDFASQTPENSYKGDIRGIQTVGKSLQNHIYTGEIQAQNTNSQKTSVREYCCLWKILVIVVKAQF